MNSESCNSRTSRAILGTMAALNVGFGLVIALSLIPRPHFMLQTILIGLDVVMTVVLLGGVFEKKRRLVVVFLCVSSLLILLETIAFGAFRITELAEDDRRFGVGVFVVRWLLQLTAVWAYFNMQTDVKEVEMVEGVALKS